ncbi:MAG: PIN domain-containing protein [Verrucomicrobia bacterium]|nr:PIN domain-containing protein [Verrucomicrobiota bacterium]MCH8511247.1 PIN domain-containing protein [Kiritimatiellia bacterium]
MDRLFFDTNVLLDVLEQRAPWFPESTECLARARRGFCMGAITAITLSDIAYIQKSVSTANLYKRFRLLRDFLEIAPLHAETVDATLARRLPDIEDGFQLEAALNWQATHLLTRNVKDFPQHPSLVVQTPTDYLHTG